MRKASVKLYCYGPSVIRVTVTKGGHPRGDGLYGTSGTMGRGVSRVTWLTQYVHEVGTWERHVLKSLDVLTYQMPTYLTITIGRSYIFKYTVPTIK